MRQRLSLYVAALGAFVSLLLLLAVGFAVVLVKVAIAVFVALLIFLAVKFRRRK